MYLQINGLKKLKTRGAEECKFRKQRKLASQRFTSKNLAEGGSTKEAPVVTESKRKKNRMCDRKALILSAQQTLCILLIIVLNSRLKIRSKANSEESRLKAQ